MDSSWDSAMKPISSIWLHLQAQDVKYAEHFVSGVILSMLLRAESSTAGEL